MNPETKASLPYLSGFCFFLALTVLHPVFFHLEGHSMEPALYPGEVVIVAPRPTLCSEQGILSSGEPGLSENRSAIDSSDPTIIGGSQKGIIIIGKMPTISRPQTTSE